MVLKNVSEDSAQVRIPPPLTILLYAIASILLRVYAPSPLLPTLLRWGLGGWLFLMALLLAAWAFRQFKKHGTNIAPWEPTSVIMQSGPFRFSRNPVYLSFLVGCVGISCLANNAWSFFLLLPLFVFLDRYVVTKEERYLTAKFGEAYLSYQRGVRRWL